MSVVQTQARLAANRVEGAVSVDPFTIFSIVTSVLLRCMEQDNPTPQEVHDSFHDMYARNPRKTENRVRHRISVECRKQNRKRISDDELERLTDAYIVQALGATEDDVVACFNELGA